MKVTSIFLAIFVFPYGAVAQHPLQFSGIFIDDTRYLSLRLDGQYAVMDIADCDVVDEGEWFYRLRTLRLQSDFGRSEAYVVDGIVGEGIQTSRGFLYHVSIDPTLNPCEPPAPEPEMEIELVEYDVSLIGKAWRMGDYEQLFHEDGRVEIVSSRWASWPDGGACVLKATGTWAYVEPSLDFVVNYRAVPLLVMEFPDVDGVVVGGERTYYLNGYSEREESFRLVLKDDGWTRSMSSDGTWCADYPVIRDDPDWTPP